VTEGQYQESLARQAAEKTTGNPDFRSGFVSIVGRPNVGKSTLVNALVGRKVAVTSDRPETTRHDLRAIMNRPGSQIVLVDTPGIHRPRTLLGQRLDDMVKDALSEVDAVCFVLPADQKLGPGDQRILHQLGSQFAKPHEPFTSAKYWRKPVIAIITKIDRLSKADLINKIMEIDQFGHFTQIVPVSALKGDNVDEVARVLISSVPIGPKMYPDSVVTEESEKRKISEIVRGALLSKLTDELPHSLAVVTDEIIRPEEGETDENGRPAPIRVLVTLYVERDSQKPIIIGHHAQNLIWVRAKTRTALKEIVGGRARLEMHVAVARGWQSNPKELDRLGFE
jgi:GTP-binding protein Era